MTLAMPASSTRPRKFTRWNPDLATNTRRTYGFEAYCACGWEGKVWKSHREAQLERSFHVCASDREG